jgi:hypothetical protein
MSVEPGFVMTVPFLGSGVGGMPGKPLRLSIVKIFHFNNSESQNL